jgi:carbamoylphosphate synthase large subunit
MTLRIAVTGVSGDVGRGAIQGLRHNSPEDEPLWLLGLDGSAYPSNPAPLDSFAQLPLVKDPSYVDALLEALQAHEIDVLLPGIDSEIAILSRSRQRFAAADTKVVLAPSALVEAADDKLLTVEFLSALGIGVPLTCDAGSPTDIGLPIIAKPRRGHASRGIAFLDDRRALETFLDGRPQGYCLQRHIDGPEITVGFLYDTEGVMRDAIAMERSLENGRTVRARLVDDPTILQFMEEFGRKVPGLGAVNAQLRWDERQGPMVFEINARLSGSTDMRVIVGFNDPLRLALHFGRGTPIVRAQPRKAVVHRAGAELLVEPC